MANEDTFDVSPNRIEPKGKVRGVTRISKKAKMVAFIVLGGVLLLVTVATYQGFQANKPAAQNPDGSSTQKKEDKTTAKGITPASLSDHMKGVGDGQSALVASSAMPITGNVSPALPEGTMPGTGVALPEEGKPASAAGSTPPVSPGGGKRKEVPGISSDLMAPDGGIREPGRSGKEIENEKTRNAIEARMDVDFEVTSKRDARNQPPPKIPDIAAGLAGLASAGAGATAAGRAANAADDPNKQQRKEQFLKEAESQPDRSYLPETRRPAISKYELAVGWKIPAALECGANTDLPGQLCAIVRENVCDSATGKYLLIPQGTKVVGTYDSQVAIGQERILVVWNQLQFEDGSSLDLKGMPGADQAGYAGFDAEVNNHYTRAVAMTGMMSIFSAGVQLSQPQTAQGTGAPTAGQTIAASIGQQVGQLGVQVTQRQLQIQPTLTRERGYRFNIMLTRKVVFPGAHKTRWGGCS